MGYRTDYEWADAHGYTPCPCGAGEWTDTGVCGACVHEDDEDHEEPDPVRVVGECLVCGEDQECTPDEDDDLVCDDCWA